MPRVRTREWAGVDYYAVLGVRPGAAPAEVDDAFRRQAKELHPDRNPEPGAEERFKGIATAYGALRDPGTRAAYDDFRRRVTEGTRYDRAPHASAPPPAAERWGPPPRRVRRRRAPMPDWMRSSIAVALVVAGVVVAVWAAVGALPSNTAGDTPVAVQITLGIMAAKLVACGFIVHWYPQLRARWMPRHRAPV